VTALKIASPRVGGTDADSDSFVAPVEGAYRGGDDVVCYIYIYIAL
jgi:hypothetical protein